MGYCDFCDKDIEDPADICKPCREEGRHTDVMKYCPKCRKGFLVESRGEWEDYADHLETHISES
jgi:predicted amidophosphoribosyltransferase